MGGLGSNPVSAPRRSANEYRRGRTPPPNPRQRAPGRLAAGATKASFDPSRFER